MTADPDPYQLLSVPQSATPDQIRRAYKKACLRYHPDKHPAGHARQQAEGKFKAISRAYSQLCDHLDSRRSVPTPPKPHAHHAFPFDPFCDFFNPATFNPPPEKLLDLHLTLEEFYNGVVKKRQLKNSPDAPVMTIAVKPGYRPGDRIRFKQAAANQADVVFVLQAKPHHTYHLDGDDLKMTMRVNLVDALAGALLIVKSLDNSEMKVRVDSVIHPTYVHTVPNAGMPRREQPSEKGNLYVSFETIFPKRVEADDRSAVRDLFLKLEAHSRNRMAMRRSSSLFTSRGPAQTFMHNRRASTVPMPRAQPTTEETPIERRAKSRRRFTSMFR